MEQELSTTQPIYALQHLETHEYVCLLQSGIDHLACFSDGDSAMQFRAEQKLQEHVDIVATTLQNSPFSYFWLDGKIMHVQK